MTTSTSLLPSLEIADTRTGHESHWVREDETATLCGKSDITLRGDFLPATWDGGPVTTIATCFRCSRSKRKFGTDQYPR